MEDSIPCEGSHLLSVIFDFSYKVRRPLVKGSPSLWRVPIEDVNFVEDLVCLRKFPTKSSEKPPERVVLRHTMSLSS
ncbi:hypothetical protein E2C01_071662 [Portunus trituberculatus]|uniref:Uncharacterized protein n=1 Tax=Portunus trituberculatus TaxID=210409 RepID=A0A5B7I8U8_PORTR|nr:hypothetical protein [Portunus trituberculatus]